MVDGQAAVRIPVVSDTKLAASLDDGSLQGLGVRRTGVQVDVAAVRLGVDNGDVGAKLTENGRPQLGGGAVRTVDRDLHAAQVGANSPHEMREVGILSPRVIGVDLTDAIAGGALPLRIHEGLNLILNGIGELVTAVREELNAVIGHRIVGGGNHDAEVNGVLGSRQMRDSGRGDDADAGHIHAGARQASREGVIEELARNARVTPNDRAGLRTVRAPSPTELAGGGLAELEREIRGDVNVCQSTHAVRAEHPGHNVSVQWVIRLV